MQITNKKRAAEQLAEIKASQAQVAVLTSKVVVALKQYVMPIPVGMRCTSTEVLKQYLSMDHHGRAKVNRFFSLREQTHRAIEAVREHYDWAVATGLVTSEVEQSQQTTKTVDNNGWGKDLDTTNVQIREATHADYVSHAAKKGKGHKKPAGKK